jgi:hypothetical protein
MIITLTSDFGNEGYVGAMKGRILSIAKNVSIVDITHNVKPFNIYHGAYVLLTSIPYFPPSIHVAVVDPTVGSERNSIVVITRDNHYLIGPDNGLFTYLVERMGVKKIIKIDEDRYNPSSTFHGRDIYSVVAAEIASGSEIKGTEIESIVKLNPEPCVIHIDVFGNIITNIRKEDIDFNYGDNIRIKIKHNMKNKEKKEKIIDCKFVKSYYEKEEGFLALINSEGFLEIALFMDSAAETLEVGYLDRIEIL